jgi:hypothetical protein
VQGRTAWHQTSDWAMLFVPLGLQAGTDAFAVQASYYLPEVVDWPKAASFVVFTSPGTKDPADLVHGQGITLNQEPGKGPTFAWGVPEGWTTARVTAEGPAPAPISGRWRTLRIEGSREQCWLRVLLDGKEVHTGTEPCDPTGGYVMLGSLHGGGHPVNGAWSDLRVFRGAPVERIEVEVHETSMQYLHVAKARALLRRPGEPDRRTRAPMGVERPLHRDRGRRRSGGGPAEGRGDAHREMRGQERVGDPRRGARLPTRPATPFAVSALTSPRSAGR